MPTPRIRALRIAWNLAFIALLVVIVSYCARAETVTGVGAHYSWTFTLAAQPTGTSYLLLSTQDADQPAEGTLFVGSWSTPLWGEAGSPANDTVVCRFCWRNVVIEVPGSAWVPGANNVTMAMTRPEYGLHDVRSAILFTTEAPDAGLVAYARQLVATGAAPPWLDAGDEFFLRQREDTDPPRTYACAEDAATGAQAARWTTADVLGAQALPPPAPPPATTSCDLAWCFATGATRAADIRAACP